MAQYSIVKANNLITLTASGNTPAPVVIPLNIKGVSFTGDSLVLNTDYFPITIKTAENTITYGTSILGINAAPADIAKALNDYLFPPQAPSVQVSGYASVGAKTTGGEGGKTVTVTTLSALKSAAAATEPLIIKVSGTIKGTGSVLVKSNKSIIGVTGATMDGVGLRIYGSSTSAYVKNIIVQNLKIKNVLQVDPATGGGDNDCISLKYADHVWVDHCELSADLAHADWEYYDGLIDISKQSDYVTVSWCKLIDSFKGSLVGGSSDAGQGRLRITYHHNLFQNIAERGPSYSYGKGHVYNNYYLNGATRSGYSIGSRFGATVSVEGNYFENVPNPIRTDIDSTNGFIASNKGNVYKNSPLPRITTRLSTYVPEYQYTLDKAEDLPTLLKQAGATLNIS